MRSHSENFVGVEHPYGADSRSRPALRSCMFGSVRKSTHQNQPPFCNFFHRNAWVLCADADANAAAISRRSI